MRRLSTQDQNFKQVFADLLAFETVSDRELLKTVDQIIADVRQHGNAHVLNSLNSSIDIPRINSQIQN